MNKQNIKLRQDAIRWTHFTRRSDAIFRSLGREISIGVLSVATLVFATPQSATARVATSNNERTNAIGNVSDTGDDDIPPISVGMLQEGDLLFTAVNTTPTQPLMVKDWETPLLPLPKASTVLTSHMLPLHIGKKVNGMHLKPQHVMVSGSIL